MFDLPTLAALVQPAAAPLTTPATLPGALNVAVGMAAAYVVAGNNMEVCGYVQKPNVPGVLDWMPED